ncbi:radical SAM protein [candidate division KSB1 bacterium]|nr:radical SAM protein [candidate division KSB1 bacterium]
MHLPPPESLIFELPGRDTGCPCNCKHCIHRNVLPGAFPNLTHEEILKILQEGRALGIESLNIYPHYDEISIPPYKSHPYLKIGFKLGYKVKTVSNGTNPEGISRILPYIYRLAISTDAFDKNIYGLLREREKHDGLMETLKMLKSYRKKHKILLTGLVMVTRDTLDSLEERVEQIVHLDVFDKIKLLEMLPIGEAANIAEQAFYSHDDFQQLVQVRAKFLNRVRFSATSWRIRENGRRGCQLGAKYFVIGPQGQIAGCNILFYLNRIVGNVREFDSLAEIWTEALDVYRQKSSRPVGNICQACRFYEENLCWGGCLGRMIIFGRENEINRSCHILNREDSEKLYNHYIQSVKNCPVFFAGGR